MLYIALWVVFGGFALMIVAYNLFDLIKFVWFKRIGPTIYYLITGDANSLPRR